MAPKLPPIGVEAVVKGFDVFGKNLDQVNKRIQDATDKTKAAAKNADPLSKALDKVGFSFDSIKDKVSNFTGVSGEAIDGLGEILQGILPIGPAALVAVAGVAALGAGFIALGQRGAPLIGLARAFDNITASVGLTSKTLLQDLRNASAGTISDFKLIETANVALTGATGNLGKELGQNLPRLLEIARNQAKVTGKDVDFLFNSIVEGIRKTSPLRIDNAGLIIKTGKAEEAYAASIGKTVEQLSVEEKGIAVLNATLEAGNAALEQSGNLQETNAEKIARSGATITNIFDSLSIAVQPAFGVVLDVVNNLLSQFQRISDAFAPIIGAFFKAIADIGAGIVNLQLTIIQPISDAIVSFLPYVSILFQGIATIISGAVTVIQNVVGGIVHFIQDVAQHLFGIDVSNLGKNLFEGAAHVFGAFANGIIKAANALIFPAVIGIAQFIADFLVGFSPPKMGPLSKIDQGGYNVMSAWLDGLTGVSLDPVDQVAAEVDAALGGIGKASLPQVDARLAQLDATLRPFQNRLDIIKSQFDAIAAPAKAALDAIERQVGEAQEALAGGDVAAAERLRRLDAAREAIQGQLDAQQALVDQQQIQLGLAQASQSQERALLNIRKAALEALQKGRSAAGSTAAGGAPAKEAKGKGGAALDAPGGGVVPDISVPQQGTVLDLFGGQQAVNDAIAGIQDSFASEIDTSALGEFQTNQSLLQTQFDRIGSVDLGAKLGDKFKPFTDIFDPNVEGSPANLVSKFFSPDASTPGSLASFFASVPDSIAAISKDLGTRIGTSLADMFVFFTGDGEGTLKGILSIVTGDSSVEGSVANFFSLLPERVSEAASSLFDTLKMNVFDPVSNFLTGPDSDPNTLAGILNVAVFFFEQLPSQIVAALQGIGATLYMAFAMPVINVINSVIEAAENVVKTFLGGVANFLLGIADGLGGVIDTSGIRNVANDINAKAGGVNFGRLSTALPPFLAPAAAKGGMFTDGMVKVGEKGPEYVAAASRIGVLPAEITRALDGLSSILAQPAPMMVPGGDTYNSSSSSSAYNFYGVQSDNDARRRYNYLRAGMR